MHKTDNLKAGDLVYSLDIRSENSPCVTSSDNMKNYVTTSRPFDFVEYMGFPNEEYIFIKKI